MTLRLDVVHEQGPWRFALVCETTLRAHVLGQGLFASGGKRPVAVVFHDGEDLTAMDMRGRELDVATLDRDCPGLLATFEGNQTSGDQSMLGPAGTIPRGLRNADGEK